MYFYTLGMLHSHSYPAPQQQVFTVSKLQQMMEIGQTESSHALCTYTAQRNTPISTYKHAPLPLRCHTESFPPPPQLQGRTPSHTLAHAIHHINTTLHTALPASRNSNTRKENETQPSPAQPIYFTDPSRQHHARARPTAAAGRKDSNVTI